MVMCVYQMLSFEMSSNNFTFPVLSPKIEIFCCVFSATKFLAIFHTVWNIPVIVVVVVVDSGYLIELIHQNNCQSLNSLSTFLKFTHLELE